MFPFCISTIMDDFNAGVLVSRHGVRPEDEERRLRDYVRPLPAQVRKEGGRPALHPADAQRPLLGCLRPGRPGWVARFGLNTCQIKQILPSHHYFDQSLFVS